MMPWRNAGQPLEQASEERLVEAAGSPPML
jgi:hypothetical protein